MLKLNVRHMIKMFLDDRYKNKLNIKEIDQENPIKEFLYNQIVLLKKMKCYRMTDRSTHDLFQTK